MLILPYYVKYDIDAHVEQPVNSVGVGRDSLRLGDWERDDLADEEGGTWSGVGVRVSDSNGGDCHKISKVLRFD